MASLLSCEVNFADLTNNKGYIARRHCTEYLFYTVFRDNFSLRNFLFAAIISGVFIFSSSKSSSQEIPRSNEQFTNPVTEFTEKCISDLSGCSVSTPIVIDSIREQATQSAIMAKGSECGSEMWKDANIRILTLDILSAGSAGVYFHAAKSSQYYASKFENAARNAFKESALARLRLADIALQSSCYDIADRHYRDVIIKYTMNDYQSYRQRAQIGIDEVRTRRK